MTLPVIDAWRMRLLMAAERLDRVADAPPFLAQAVRDAVPVAADLLPAADAPLGPQDFIYPH
jgi:hypothetical protein